MPGSLIQNEDAVSIQISYILSLLVLIIFTGSITSVFYLYADSSSEQAMRAGFTDLGSVIARDITNMYITSEYSQNNVTLNVTRNIPLTIGGKGYMIKLNNATPGHFASIDIIESGFNGYTVSTTLNSINVPVNAISEGVYSGSGEINIRFKKNESRWIWIN